LYNILIEFGVPMKLVRLIKMDLNETCNEVPIGNHLSDSFPIQNGHAIKKVQENQVGLKSNGTDTSASGLR
jgi:hypothetical protein